jgi:glycerol-3-phosphate dehydrogenase
VTGCGAALDAASRGLSVALIEKRDFAAGTSSRSSKLIHGGLRYLEHLEVYLVREALHERRLLLETIAPHLVHTAPFLFPMQRPGWDRFVMGSGLMIYDALAGPSPAVPRHHHLARTACRRDVPGLRDDAQCGGIRYFDAQVDDSSFVTVLARTAAAHGAVVATALCATALRREGDRITGACVLDEETHRKLDVAARVIVNATGIWANETERLAGIGHPVAVRPSKGIHLVVRRECIDSAYALILPTEKSVLFVLPWGEHWIVGTTDTDWDLHFDHPAANRADIQYLLTEVNQVLARPLGRDDVVGVYAGLRPLAATGDRDSTTVSREHEVRRSAPGLVSVLGGKFTTYRLMARDVIDAAVAELGVTAGPSVTARLPLLGASNHTAAPRLAAGHPGAARLTAGQVRRQARRRGTLALELLDLIAADPPLAQPLPGAEAYLAADARYAASHEGALHVDDVLTRRTHISFETQDRGRLAVEAVARQMAPVLGWDEPTIAREIAHYRARLAAELEAEQMPDDASADAVRATVRDPRLD